MDVFKPPGHNAVSPYLLVESAEATLAFLIATFDALELDRRVGPDGWIRHAEVRIDDSVVMMGGRPERSEPVHRSIHVYVADVDQAHAGRCIPAPFPSWSHATWITASARPACATATATAGGWAAG